MYNKKQNEKPLFAEVKHCDDEVRQQATNKDYKIDIKMLEQYIRINGRVLIRKN